MPTKSTLFYRVAAWTQNQLSDANTRIPGRDCPHEHAAIAEAVACRSEQPHDLAYSVRAWESGFERPLTDAEHEEVDRAWDALDDER